MGIGRRIVRCASVALAAGLALVGTAACNDGISLDPASTSGRTPPAATSSDSGVADSGATGDTADTIPPDLPVDLPPVGECPSGCVPGSVQLWSWDEPVEPKQPPAATHELIGILHANRLQMPGTIHVADNRDEAPWLTSLGLDGTYLTSEAVDIGCGCSLTSMDFDPLWGHILFGARDPGDQPPDYFAVCRYVPEIGQRLWTEVFGTVFPEDATPRVGSVFALANGDSGILVLQDHPNIGLPMVEQLQLFRFDIDGGFLGAPELDTQAPTADDNFPLAVTVDHDTVAIAFGSFNGIEEQGYVAWVHPQADLVEDVVPLPAPPGDLVALPNGTTLAASLVETQRGLGRLDVVRAAPLAGSGWTVTVEVPTSFVSRPSIALDSTGAAWVAVAIADQPDGPAHIRLLHLDAAGQLLSSSDLPLAATLETRSVVIATDTEDDLLLATHIDGRLHVERRRSGCACE
ncbi:MAG: hypothetical protein K0V04_32020 [Deltaproteobacteria bacterium]|nr:hypothetical protein [Deltaproteobacteria bacterium]